MASAVCFRVMSVWAVHVKIKKVCTQYIKSAINNIKVCIVKVCVQVDFKSSGNNTEEAAKK